MKKQNTKNIVSYNINTLPVDKSDWKRVNAMSDKTLKKNALTDKDSFIADEDFWRSAKLVMPSTAGKERVTVRIDKDILDFLKENGRGYQSRINAILRAYLQYAKKVISPSSRDYSVARAKKAKKAPIKKIEHSKHVR
jgi:uncharacterized protein (DUF4415 family)